MLRNSKKMKKSPKMLKNRKKHKKSSKNACPP
jgi:hypothetical protein